MKWSVLIVCAAILVPVGVGAYTLALRYFFAEPSGRVEQQEIITRGAYRIQAYEQFYRIQEDIQGIDVKLGGYPTTLDVRQRTECQGLLQVRANRVAEYNAASRAVLTQGQWRAPDLPQRLDQRNPRSCG